MKQEGTSSIREACSSSRRATRTGRRWRTGFGQRRPSKLRNNNRSVTLGDLADRYLSDLLARGDVYGRNVVRSSVRDVNLTIRSKRDPIRSRAGSHVTEKL